MFCKYCGQQLPDGSKFCGACGKPLSVEETPPAQQPFIYYPPQPPVYYPSQTPTYEPRRQKEAHANYAPKKDSLQKDKWLKIGIVTLIVLLLLMIAAFIYVLMQPEDAQKESQLEEIAATEGDTGLYVPTGAEPVEESSAAVAATETTFATETVTETTVSIETETERETSDFGDYFHDGEYILAESNSRYLTDADIIGMSERDLQMAINEIFARHGRIFTTPEIRYYFESKSWYQGTIQPEDFSDWNFNEFEQANVDFLIAAADECS